MASSNNLDANEIKKFWDQVCTECEISDHVTRKWWKVVCDSYLEPQRRYHTLRHIGHMLWLIEHEPVISTSIQHLTHVVFAVFFHDIVYDPQLMDNEDRSSELFLSFYKEAACHNLDHSLVQKYIMATKTHFTDEHSQMSEHWGNTDMHIFLDLDMAILSVEPLEYDSYADKIRQEYCHYPEETYCRKRVCVLEQFLTQRIYCSENVYKSWEESARRNIQAEITKLKSNKT